MASSEAGAAGARSEEAERVGRAFCERETVNIRIHPQLVSRIYYVTTGLCYVIAHSRS